MSVFKKINEKRILYTPTEPPSTEWLWLRAEKGTSSLYNYVNGRWTPVVAGSETDSSSSPAVQPSPSTPSVDNYVTLTTLNVRLSDLAASFNQKLSDYVLSKDIPDYSELQRTVNSLSTNISTLAGRFSNYFTKTETKSYVVSQLAGYQPKLHQGPGISIVGNVISATVNNDVDPELDSSSENAVSNKAVTEAITEINGALNNKQDTLHAGANIEIDLVTNTISASGGGGEGGSSVHVVANGTQVPVNDDIYFFSRSPLQAEGLFNNLLQNGEENGRTYSPGNLYELDAECGFRTVPKAGQVTQRNNYVYYDNVMTSMKYYGDIVVYNKIKYADTSDCAYLQWMVAAPFYAANTPVTVRFNQSVVSVYRLVATENPGYFSTKPESWRQLSNGERINVSNTQSARAELFRIERLNKDFTQSADALITLNNGYDDTEVTVKFSKCRLYYKDGIGYNDFNPSNPPAVDANLRAGLDKVASGTNYLNNKYLSVSSGFYCFATDVLVDESKFNVLYMVITQKPGTNTACCTYYKNWLNARVSTARKRFYNHTGYSGRTSIKLNLIEDYIKYQGFYIVECYIHKLRESGTKLLDLLIDSSGNGKYHIHEFGLLTYDAPI